MGFNSVYRSLQEIFPQLDYRILKAAAIEHGNDADAAVEFILSEVLSRIEQSIEDPVCRLPGQKGDDLTVGDAGNVDAHPSSKCAATSGEEERSASGSCYGTNKNQIHGKTENEGIILQLDVGLSTIPASCGNEDSGCISVTHSVVADKNDLSGPAVARSVDVSLANLKSFKDQSLKSVECAAINKMNASDYFNGFEGLQSKAPIGDAETLIVGVEVIQFSDEILMASRPAPVISTELLEKFLTEAKDYQETLRSGMESVMSMVREVQLQEKAAEDARVEASKAGLDIHAKVEELKEILQNSKQANDMHAGEVYGERSILRTEAKELQSCLINLSDRRDKCVSILNEIQDALKSRLAAADEQIAEAEQGKFQKEELARKALVEQELLVEKAVQETKELQQEAEANAKLRDFLADRGRQVDVLQGEISVICEDAKLLKEKVDGRLPISRGLSWNQISGGLFLSSTYRKSASDRSPELSNSTERVRTTSQELLISEQLIKSIGSKDGDNQKAIAGEGWYLSEDLKLEQWDVVSRHGISAEGLVNQD